MAEREQPIMQRAWVALVADGARLWRNNIGTALQGRISHVQHPSPSSGLMAGDIIIRSPWYIKFGLAVGSSDLIGYLPVTVTSEMVGKRVAVFLSAEAKNAHGHTTKEQRAWLAAVKECGGIGFAFRSEEEALQLLQAAKTDLLN